MKKIFYLSFIFIVIVFGGEVFAQNKSITLQWTNSPTPGVDGYNLYRADHVVPEFTKVNTELIPSDPAGKTEFTDTTVTYVNRYYYVCRAVILWADEDTGESGEVESVNSNQATMYLYPPAPNPPTGLIKKSSTPSDF